MRIRFYGCLLALLTLFMSAGAASAQQSATGAITGRITDKATQAPIAGATVEAVTAMGRTVASVVTNANGEYRLRNLAPGNYAVVIAMVGYQTARAANVRVVAGQTSMAGTALTPGAFLLNPVVVTASRKQEKAIDAPAAVSVVPSRMIVERPVSTPVEHLRDTPGIDIITSGVQSTNVSVRGFNNIFSGSLHALTDNRIAGVPSLRVNLMHFVASNDDDVDHMEIVLGPGAALYGPNTADGVLHIITKSPIDFPATSASVAGGSQDLIHATARTAHKFNEQFGVKLSGQFFQATEWGYIDPVEAAERAKFSTPTTAAFFKADLMNAAGITSAEADRRIALIGNRDNDINRFSGELRADYRFSTTSSFIVNAGLSRIGNAIELTGLGASQVSDWKYGYAQARFNAGRLFMQGYVNASDAGDTYLLRNGAPITDKSKLWVAQIQHGLMMGTRQNFTYGADFIYTNPITEGTINGQYEDDDQTTEIGGYVQSETQLTPKLNLVLAGRVDNSTAIPDPVFSPRAGLVFKPVETQAFRLTFNRAFSTPSSLNQFLDLGSAIPDANAARLGYSVRVQGTGRDGFSFRQSNGGYLMRSPFTPAAAGGPRTLLPADAASFFAAAVQVVATQAAAGGQPLNPQLVQFLAGLRPTTADISTIFSHPATGQVGALAQLDLADVPPVRESISNTIEAGYKGVLGSRLLFGADVWFTRRENMVTALTLQTPLLLLNGAQTATYLVPRLTQFFQAAAGMPAAQAQATAQATATALAPNLAKVPVGVISSADIDANGAQLLATYYNVDDQLDLYGADFSMTALLNQLWSVTGSLSLVNKDVFETKKGEAVTLNAPKTHGSLSLAYRNQKSGFSSDVRARYNSKFPVRSGVYNGTLCIDGKEPGAEPCVDSYTIVDLSAAYRILRTGASIQLNITNLLDEDYRSFPGVPNIGRMAILRLKYDL